MNNNPNDDWSFLRRIYEEAEQRALREAAEKRAVESERRANEREQWENQSRTEAERAQAFIKNPVASEKLGAGRLGNLDDAKNDHLLNHQGLFLGVLQGTPIYYNGDSHLLNYGLTRSGKGTDIVLPNLAHVFNRSLVVNDIKDGENAYASAEYRKSRGHAVFGVDPHGQAKKYGIKGVSPIRVNPFQRIISLAQANESIQNDCFQLAIGIVPAQNDKNKWVQQGAQFILATWLEWMAIFQPDHCTISSMYRFIASRFEIEMDAMSNSGHEGIEEQADMILRLTKADDQWAAYESELQASLINFRPDTPLAKSMENSDIDLGILKNELGTLFLMANSDLLEASSRWVVLMITAIVNACAQTSGKNRVTFIIDEMANLPHMAIMSKALTLYAGKGVQLWGLCQGRKALRAKGYADEDILNFEAQSGLFHCWNVKETDLLQDIEKWSGQTTVAIRGASQGGGAVESAAFSINEQRRAVLQSDDILKVGGGKQIIRTNGAHLYIADRIHYWDIENWKGRIRDIRTMRD